MIGKTFVFCVCKDRIHPFLVSFFARTWVLPDQVLEQQKLRFTTGPDTGFKFKKRLAYCAEKSWYV